MSNYKKIYLKLFHASEEAINILIRAQRECEQLYINEPEPELKVVSTLPDNKKSMDEE